MVGSATARSLLGRSVYDFVPTELWERAKSRRKNLTASNPIEPAIEIQLNRVDGTQIPVESQGVRILYNGGPAILNLIADITERKRAEEQLNESRERNRQQELQLIQADKMASLGVLASGIAHEINNPNNLVMFNCDLVRRIVLDILPIVDQFYEEHADRAVAGLSYQETRTEFKNLLEGITIGSERIRDIVASLKDYARIDAGAMSQPVNINDVVKSALLIAGNLVRKSTDAADVVYGDDIPITLGNAQQIEQIVINLITNACHALREKSQAIHILTKYNTVEGRILVVVSDEGIGIPEKDRLFDPFFTTKRDVGGTGLGLSISSSIAQAHKGELTVQSTEGKGTTVTLSLPVRTPEDN